MATLLAATAALSDLSYDGLLLALLTIVMVAALLAMGRPDLDNTARKLIGRYMVVSLVVLILVALTVWKLHGSETECLPPLTPTSYVSAFGLGVGTSGLGARRKQPWTLTGVVALKTCS